MAGEAHILTNLHNAGPSEYPVRPATEHSKYAKQTQFSETQNQCNHCSNKSLHHAEQKHTLQSKPNFPDKREVIRIQEA